MALSVSNLLIECLSPEVRLKLVRQLEPVALPVNTTIYEPEEQPRHVHLLTSGMASIVVVMANGDVAEVGIVTREGPPEALHLLGPAGIQTRAFMQIAGTGLRMSFKAFQELTTQEPEISVLLLNYVQYQSLTLGQIAACNRLHEVEERMARWLLMVQDRIGGNEIPLTQEFIANMLGTRRSTVTLIAGALQRSGLIEYRRGNVKVLDRQGLESTACECYEVTRRLLLNLYKTSAAAVGVGELRTEKSR